jgi:hypothetical protein
MCAHVYSGGTSQKLADGPCTPSKRSFNHFINFGSSIFRVFRKIWKTRVIRTSRYDTSTAVRLRWLRQNKWLQWDLTDWEHAGTFLDTLREFPSHWDVRYWTVEMNSQDSFDQASYDIKPFSSLIYSNFIINNYLFDLLLLFPDTSYLEKLND